MIRIRRDRRVAKSNCREVVDLTLSEEYSNSQNREMRQIYSFNKFNSITNLKISECINGSLALRHLQQVLQLLQFVIYVLLVLLRCLASAGEARGVHHSLPSGCSGSPLRLGYRPRVHHELGVLGGTHQVLVRLYPSCRVVRFVGARPVAHIPASHERPLAVGAERRLGVLAVEEATAGGSEVGLRPRGRRIVRVESPLHRSLVPPDPVDAGVALVALRLSQGAIRRIEPVILRLRLLPVSTTPHRLLRMVTGHGRRPVHRVPRSGLTRHGCIGAPPLA